VWHTHEYGGAIDLDALATSFLSLNENGQQFFHSEAQMPSAYHMDKVRVIKARVSEQAINVLYDLCHLQNFLIRSILFS
jgi:hypothetical protein